MAKFKVNIIQHNVYTYVVEANGNEDAKEKAYEVFLNELRWVKPDSDYDRIEVEALER